MDSYKFSNGIYAEISDRPHGGWHLPNMTYRLSIILNSAYISALHSYDGVGGFQYIDQELARLIPDPSHKFGQATGPYFVWAEFADESAARDMLKQLLDSCETQPQLFPVQEINEARDEFGFTPPAPASSKLQTLVSGSNNVKKWDDTDHKKWLENNKAELDKMGLDVEKMKLFTGPGDVEKLRQELNYDQKFTVTSSKLFEQYADDFGKGSQAVKMF